MFNNQKIRYLFRFSRVSSFSRRKWTLDLDFTGQNTEMKKKKKLMTLKQKIPFILCLLCRNDVLVANVFNEFQRQGLVSKYKMELQDLLMKVAGKEETLDSDIKFGSFIWADKVLSLYDFSATIAQVLPSVINVVRIFV